jgi:SAM-dependent methyltransferase
VRVANGDIYALVDGRARYVPSPEVLERVLGDREIKDVGVLEARMEYGAPVPSLGPVPKTAAEMRAWLCRNFSGVGVEFGAGARPTELPLTCRVQYAAISTPSPRGGEVMAGHEAAGALVQADLIVDITKMQAFAKESLDFIIASHVIEHVPDPFAVFAAAARTLRPHGSLMLIVPDQRRTFDARRQTTSIARLAAEHFEGDASASLASYVEMALDVEDLPLMTALARARERHAARQDTHLHTFTFESFTRLARLAAQNFGFSQVTSHPGHFADAPGANEFYFVLEK